MFLISDCYDAIPSAINVATSHILSFNLLYCFSFFCSYKLIRCVQRKDCGACIKFHEMYIEWTQCKRETVYLVVHFKIIIKWFIALSCQNIKCTYFDNKTECQPINSKRNSSKWTSTGCTVSHVRIVWVNLRITKTHTSQCNQRFILICHAHYINDHTMCDSLCTQPILGFSFAYLIFFSFILVDLISVAI